jgi:ABC-2 type transport system ATP-binding protein
MNNALEVNNLCKKYDDFYLDSISFILPAGKIMGFVGQNGAGKTTTIQLILNMLSRINRQVKIYGLDNIKDELKVKQDIAAVFDEIFFVDIWRISEVEKAVRGFYSQWDSDEFKNYLEKFKLLPHKKVKDLSRGMKMKLMLSVAMSHKAKLLILDEPTSGLDPVTRDELLDILREYISDGEKSVFFSTHITSDLEKIADYITLIDNGKVFFTGTRNDLESQFIIVKGNTEQLTDNLKSRLIGIWSNSKICSGMLRSSESELISNGFQTETPSIDEILVRISKGEIK